MTSPAAFRLALLASLEDLEAFLRARDLPWEAAFEVPARDARATLRLFHGGGPAGPGPEAGTDGQGAWAVYRQEGPQGPFHRVATLHLAHLTPAALWFRLQDLAQGRDHRRLLGRLLRRRPPGRPRPSHPRARPGSRRVPRLTPKAILKGGPVVKTPEATPLASKAPRGVWGSCRPSPHAEPPSHAFLALLDPSMPLIRRPAHPAPGTFRYRLTPTGRSSERYGPCEVCHQHASEVFHLVEERAYALHGPGLPPEDPHATGWTRSGCQDLFGHEACLLQARRGPQLPDEPPPGPIRAPAPGKPRREPLP